MLNPAMLLLAGRRHWYAAALRHTGRRTGRIHTTPIVAERVSDGFITPLPYGTDVDWLRNVAAAGSATIAVDGRSFDVANPQVIDAATAARQLSVRRIRAFERFGVAHFVKFDLAADTTARDVGVSGGVASAEEAAVHIIEGDR